MLLLSRCYVWIRKHELEETRQLSPKCILLQLNEDICQLKCFTRLLSILSIGVGDLFLIPFDEINRSLFWCILFDQSVQSLFFGCEDTHEENPSL